MDYKDIYLKLKKKYLEMKAQVGGQENLTKEQLLSLTKEQVLSLLESAHQTCYWLYLFVFLLSCTSPVLYLRTRSSCGFRMS